MSATRIIRRFRQLRDVIFVTPNTGDAAQYDAGLDKIVVEPLAAEHVTVTPFGSIGSTDAQAALEELAAEVAGGVTDHGALTGLGDNDHPQYQLAATAATDAELAAAVAAHEADTSVHGIANTTVLATDAELAAAVSASEAGQVRDGDAAGGVLAGTYPNPSFAADMATQAELNAVAAAAVNDGDGAGGVLSGTYPNPGFAADMATQAELDAHVNDAVDAHDASAISFTPNGSIAATDVQAAIQEVRDEAGGGGAPTTADYLVGTAQAGLSAEIVVGASPGGELGGTWASPTVDATHSGSSHAGVQSAAEATAAAALAAHLAADVVDGDGAGGVLSGTYPNPGFAVDMATQAELDAHVNDAADAHDASSISILDAAADFTATDVEGALAELQTDAEADEASLAAHLADASDAHDASAISSVAAGGLAATDVQAALNELDTEKQPLDADLTAIAALTTDAAGRGLLTLTDPGADRIVFWDDSAGAYAHLTPGTNLTITGTTLDASGGGTPADDENLILHMQAFA